MQTQATRYTPKQLAYLAYWEARGYTFGRDDVIPESTEIKPGEFARNHPILDAVCGALLLVFAIGGAFGQWVKYGAGL